MRQGQQNRRNRGRGRSNNRSNNPLSRNYESNGPEVKIKGSAAHIAEKYMALARDALSSGNTVTAENYFQHAEHYNRIIQAAQAKQEEHQAAQNAKSGRNNERRSRPQTDKDPQAPAKRDEPEKKPAAKAEIPGTGEQPPVINGNGASGEKAAEKPKRKPRVRKPKVAKAENTENAEAPEGKDNKDETSNVTA